MTTPCLSSEYTSGICPFCLCYLGSVCYSDMVWRLLPKIWMNTRIWKVGLFFNKYVNFKYMQFSKEDVVQLNIHSDLLSWQNLFLKMVLKTVLFWKFCKTCRNISMMEFIAKEVTVFRIVIFLNEAKEE